MIDDNTAASLLLLSNTALWPLLASLIVCLLGVRAGSGRWLLPTAVVAGAGVGILLVHVDLQFPPARSADRLLPLLVAAWLLVSLLRLSPARTRWLAAGLSITVAMVWLLWPLLQRWSLPTLALQLAGALLVWLALWWLAQRSAESPAGASGLLAPLAMAAPVVAIDGSLLIAQFFGVIAASLGGWWLVTLWRGSAKMGAAGALFLSLALGAPLLLAYHYAGLDLAAVLLLALSPALLLPLQGLLQARPLWLQRFAGGAVAALPGLLALWLIWPEESLY